MICEHCGFRNRPGELLCRECGTSLANNPLATKQITPDELRHTERLGSDRFGCELLIRIKDQEKPIRIDLIDHLILGRSDAGSKAVPDVDLAPYGAFDQGVSRMHAQISRNGKGITITDIGSSNGTYLNGQQLAQNAAHVLCDGDQIRLSQLTMRIIFGK